MHTAKTRLQKVLLNRSNHTTFVPNEIKRFVPRDPPWITKPLKTMLNREKTWL